MKILEVGCGTHRNPRSDYAIDCNQGTQADEIMDVHDLRFPDYSYERVLLFEVLEHLENPLRALKEINRVMKIRGTLELSIPNP